MNRILLPTFIPGLDLAERFYTEAVQPILAAHFPDLPHSAALIGAGSEVLGFDTEMSSDHHWGPRVMLFLSEADYAAYADVFHDRLAHTLPREFLGYSTHFEVPPDDPTTTVLVSRADGLIAHRVEVYTPHGYFIDTLGFDPLEHLTVADWLTTPPQILRTITDGRIFRDDLGTLTESRNLLSYYPDEIWRYLLANQWRRIDQEEPMMGRAGSVGDDLGSHIVAMRLVRDVMRLCFLMERAYAPYIKWFGTAFSKLRSAPILMPHMQAVMRATDWQTREAALTPIYETLAQMHNDLGITEPLPTRVSPFFSRPFQVIQAGEFAAAIHATLTDAAILRLPPYLGGIDQWVDSTDVLSDPDQYRQLLFLYL